MSLTKKIALGIVSFLAILLLGTFGLNFWLTNQLPKIIKENNKTPYHITYDQLTIDLLPSNIYIYDLAVIPKIKPKNSTKKIGIYAKAKSIIITDFNVWSYLFKNIIKARSITVEKPAVILYRKDKNANNIRKEVVAPFAKMIVVSNIYLLKGTLDVVSTQDNEPILSSRNISTTLEGIVIDDEILDRPIPFLYQKYVVACDSLYYKPNEFYTLKAHKIRTTNHSLHLKNLEYLPEYTRAQFVQRIPKEKDLFTIKASSLDINSMNWGFKKDVFFFNANSVLLDGVSANIYRNRIPKDDLSKKPLYNALLRKIKFPLSVDTILIRRSKLVYEEEINFKKGPAKLTFDHFDLNATHLQSGFGLKKAADTDIKINCRFMKDSPLKIHWTFNVLDLKDGFAIKGNIHNFDFGSLNQFTKPYFNASFKGTFNSFHLNITGNDKNANGNFALKYQDLEVTFYKKNKPEKEAELKNLVAKLLLKKNSDTRSKKAQIELERKQEKSFYNLLWRSIAKFLKVTLL